LLREAWYSQARDIFTGCSCTSRVRYSFNSISTCKRREMQLYQNVGLLAANTAENLPVLDEDLKYVYTSEEPVATSFMAPEDGTELVPILAPEKQFVEPIDARELSCLLTKQGGLFLDTVLVDCRPYLAYSSSHIVGAHNVCFPSLLARRRQRRLAGSDSHIPPIPLENIVRCNEVRTAVLEGRCRRVVVYDEDTDSVHWPEVNRGCRISPGSSQLTSVLHSLVDCGRSELHFLKGSSIVFVS